MIALSWWIQLMQYRKRGIHTKKLLMGSELVASLKSESDKKFTVSLRFLEVPFFQRWGFFLYSVSWKNLQVMIHLCKSLWRLLCYQNIIFFFNKLSITYFSPFDKGSLNRCSAETFGEKDHDTFGDNVVSVPIASYKLWKKQMLLWPKLCLPLDCFQQGAGLTLTPTPWTNLEAAVTVMETSQLAWCCNCLTHATAKLSLPDCGSCRLQSDTVCL